MSATAANGVDTGPDVATRTRECRALFDRIAIPESLRVVPQWVCWRFERRDGALTKVPIDAARGRRAKSTDPSTWTTFERAVAMWESDDALAGLGFVFADGGGFTGIDLDECLDDRGTTSDGARAIIAQLDSYTEVSPSGRGVKIFVRGTKPESAGAKSKLVAGHRATEVYSGGRFFTVTGRCFAGTNRIVADRQRELEDLCGRLWPPKPSRTTGTARGMDGFEGDDAALVERACAARDDGRFRRLWQGDISMHGDDHSAADQALTNRLAFWTGRDPARMDRLFRASGLFREKWDERRGDRTYGQRTIQLAIADCADTYRPRRARQREREAAPPSDDLTDAEVDAEADSAMPDRPDHVEDQCIALGQRDPKSGRLVLSPRRTLPTAEAYAREFHAHAEGTTLVAFGGLVLEWRGNRYVQVEDGAIKHRLQPWLHKALRYSFNAQSKELELVDFESNPTTVEAALKTIRAFVHLPATTRTPSWLDARKDRPDALEVLPCRSMSMHVPTGRVLRPTPALFTMNALEFDYEPDAEAPERWIKFLEQVFGDDLDAVGLLQEWFGYCLIADTSQQKMLLLVGPRRSGKGTIGRVLTRMIGAGNVVGPTTTGLAGTFGLQPLIDKSLAIVSDARFSGDGIATVIERLLCISGEDALTVDRKFMESVSMKLSTRFMLLTNELPKLHDASTALAGRFLVLRLTRSFYGNEDPTLTSQLLEELPGILLWSIEGLKRLRARGRFMQPASGEESIADMEDLGSPVAAFVRDCCTVGTGHRAWIDSLYQAWRGWCEADGRNVVSTKQSFGRDLAAAVPGISRRRGTGMAAFYEGIAIREVGA